MKHSRDPAGTASAAAGRSTSESDVRRSSRDDDGLDYAALIREQRRELDELKRIAAREEASKRQANSTRIEQPHAERIGRELPSHGHDARKDSEDATSHGVWSEEPSQWHSSNGLKSASTTAHQHRNINTNNNSTRNRYHGDVPPRPSDGSTDANGDRQQRSGRVVLEGTTMSHGEAQQPLGKSALAAGGGERSWWAEEAGMALASVERKPGRGYEEGLADAAATPTAAAMAGAGSTSGGTAATSVGGKTRGNSTAGTGTRNGSSATAVRVSWEKGGTGDSSRLKTAGHDEADHRYHLQEREDNRWKQTKIGGLSRRGEGHLDSGGSGVGAGIDDDLIKIRSDSLLDRRGERSDAGLYNHEGYARGIGEYRTPYNLSTAEVIGGRAAVANGPGRGEAEPVSATVGSQEHGLGTHLNATAALPPPAPPTARTSVSPNAAAPAESMGRSHSNLNLSSSYPLVRDAQGVHEARGARVLDPQGQEYNYGPRQYANAGPPSRSPPSPRRSLGMETVGKVTHGQEMGERRRRLSRSATASFPDDGMDETLGRAVGRSADRTNASGFVRQSAGFAPTGPTALRRHVQETQLGDDGDIVMWTGSNNDPGSGSSRHGRSYDGGGAGEIGGETGSARHGIPKEAAFRSASWADRLVVKREEQSVLARQLERELASTVSALRDERRERRSQTEVLRAKLDEANGTIREREAELERREAMARTLMSELEAVQSRCDRLSVSREEQAAEAEKNTKRLTEDNGELEARLREARSTAAEAQAEREAAKSERDTLVRENASGRILVAAAERRANQAEAALATTTALAQVHQNALGQSKSECDGLRTEMEGLRARLNEAGGADEIAGLRAQVADLERQLETTTQRCGALQTRLGLVEQELVAAEENEAEARAKLRWALGRVEAENAAGREEFADTATRRDLTTDVDPRQTDKIRNHQVEKSTAKLHAQGNDAGMLDGDVYRGEGSSANGEEEIRSDDQDEDCSRVVKGFREEIKPSVRRVEDHVRTNSGSDRVEKHHNAPEDAGRRKGVGRPPLPSPRPSPPIESSLPRGGTMNDVGHSEVPSPRMVHRSRSPGLASTLKASGDVHGRDLHTQEVINSRHGNSQAHYADNTTTSRDYHNDSDAQSVPVATVGVVPASQEYRKPNRRSMVPALFPPGWRDREITPTRVTPYAAAVTGDTEAGYYLDSQGRPTVDGGRSSTEYRISSGKMKHHVPPDTGPVTGNFEFDHTDGGTGGRRRDDRTIADAMRPDSRRRGRVTSVIDTATPVEDGGKYAAERQERSRIPSTGAVPESSAEWLPDYEYGIREGDEGDEEEFMHWPGQDRNNLHMVADTRRHASQEYDEAARESDQAYLEQPIEYRGSEGIRERRGQALDDEGVTARSFGNMITRASHSSVHAVRSQIVPATAAARRKVNDVVDSSSRAETVRRPNRSGIGSRETSVVLAAAAAENATGTISAVNHERTSARNQYSPQPHQLRRTARHPASPSTFRSKNLVEVDGVYAWDGELEASIVEGRPDDGEQRDGYIVEGRRRQRLRVRVPLPREVLSASVPASNSGRDRRHATNGAKPSAIGPKRRRATGATVESAAATKTKVGHASAHPRPTRLTASTQRSTSTRSVASAVRRHDGGAATPMKRSIDGAKKSSLESKARGRRDHELDHHHASLGTSLPTSRARVVTSGVARGSVVPLSRGSDSRNFSSPRTLGRHSSVDLSASKRSVGSRKGVGDTGRAGVIGGRNGGGGSHTGPRSVNRVLRTTNSTTAKRRSSFVAENIAAVSSSSNRRSVINSTPPHRGASASVSRAPVAARTAAAVGAGLNPTSTAGPAPVNRGTRSARQHSSLMRRRKEQNGIESSFASSQMPVNGGKRKAVQSNGVARASLGGGARRELTRSGVKSVVGKEDASICSSGRAWKP